MSNKVMDFFGELGFKVDFKTLNKLEKQLVRIDKIFSSMGKDKGFKEIGKAFAEQNKQLEKQVRIQNKLNREIRKANEYDKQVRRSDRVPAASKYKSTGDAKRSASVFENFRIAQEAASTAYNRQMFAAMTQKTGYSSAKESYQAFSHIFEAEDAKKKESAMKAKQKAQAAREQARQEKSISREKEKQSKLDAKAIRDAQRKSKWQERLENSARRQAGMFGMMNSSLIHMVASLGSVYAIMQGMGHLKESGKFFENVAAGYQLAFGEEGGDRIQGKLAEFAKEIGASQKDILGEGRTFLTSAVPLMGEQKALESFQAFNIIGKAGGASQEQMHRAMVGFSQLQTGEYAQSQELRQQIAENMPVIVKELAGRMFPELSAQEAQRALKRGMKENTLVVEEINKAIREAGKEISQTKAFKKMTQNLSAWETRFRNALTGRNGMLQMIGGGASTGGTTGSMTSLFESLTLAIMENETFFRTLGDVLNRVMSHFELLMINIAIFVRDFMGGEDKMLSWIQVADGLFTAFVALTGFILGKTILALAMFTRSLLMGSAAAGSNALSKMGGAGGKMGGLSRLGKLGVLGAVGYGSYSLANMLGAESLGKSIGGGLYNLFNDSPSEQIGKVPVNIAKPTSSSQSNSQIIQVDKVEVMSDNAQGFIDDMTKIANEEAGKNFSFAMPFGG